MGSRHRIHAGLLACWLAITPFVLGYAPDQIWLWANDLTASFAIALVALLSFRRGLHRIHLLNLAAAIWLVILGFLGAASPAAQNHVVVGLLLGMMAIVPSRASGPPLAWRQDFAERQV